MTMMNQPTGLSRHLPYPDAVRLCGAASDGDEAMRLHSIDSITDDLARRGLVRPRNCDARAAEWQAERDARAALAVAMTGSVPASRKPQA
ncbi:MAG: hypothetical protein ACR2JA_14030 [Hydrogenophaga sp.]|uniref:hypothetical protein n=1 Tax=Hydrogenophaga sp. TaxID=1904254 RepID=UPI003D9BBD0D